MRYISRIPKKVAKGRVLMHNHIRHTIDMPAGVNGFRFWTDAEPPPGFKRCGCGWSGLPHYSRMPRGYRCETRKDLGLAWEDFTGPSRISAAR